MATLAKTPLPVVRALRKLGEDIRDARRRRRIPTELMAQRCGISRATLRSLEKGHAGASMGAYATALFVLGLLDSLADLADARWDQVGLDLAGEQLPQRIRARRNAGY